MVRLDLEDHRCERSYRIRMNLATKRDEVRNELFWVDIYDEVEYL